MNYPYDCHSWSKLYREDALQEAQVRGLVSPARSLGRERRSGPRAVIWSGLLSMVGRTRVAE